MERIIVLHAKERLSSDGATVVLLNMARELKEEVQFDFILYSMEGNDWAWKFEELGSKIYYREAQKHNPITNRIERFKLYNKFFKDNPYTIIHINTDSIERFDILFSARRHGVKKRIYHSHNSKAEGRMARVPIYKGILKFLIARVATDLLACSTEAAEWMFPKKCQSDVKIIKNGIYTDKFRYNSVSRTKIRNQYNLGNNYVIGCVARFAQQKNHQFLINIFAEIVKEEKNAQLMLIGDGVLKEDIQKQVEALHLKDKVIFIGNTDKVNEYMSAMDIYVMPSLFEGLGMVFIEAQASGLFCLASNCVSREARVTEHIQFISLDENSQFWANVILSKTKEVLSLDRGEAWKEVENAGYDIREASHKLLEVYKQNVD